MTKKIKKGSKMKKEFLVLENGACKMVFIPKEYCLIYLQNQAKDHIEISKVGDDVCIENLSQDLPCQKIKQTKKGVKK